MDLDVNELFVDPDVGGDGFEVVRRRQTVGADGAPVTTEIPLGAQVGAVYPTGAQSLVRAEAYETQLNTITVVTQFRLYTAGEHAGVSYDADLVVWSGRRYIVKEVNEYTRYGPGFLQAECILFNWVANEPEVAPPVLGVMDFSDGNNSGLVGAI